MHKQVFDGTGQYVRSFSVPGFDEYPSGGGHYASGIACDRVGNLLVTDSDGRQIVVVSPVDGHVIDRFTLAASPSLNSCSVCVDGLDRVVVAHDKGIDVWEY